MNCNNYKDLIDIETIINVVPPILNDLEITEQNIDFLISKPILDHEIDDIGVDLNHLSSHNQPVERCVKLVTEASQAVCGEKARDGWIMNTLASRNKMKNFETKRDFVFSNELDDSLNV